MFHIKPNGPGVVGFDFECNLHTICITPAGHQSSSSHWAKACRIEEQSNDACSTEASDKCQQTPKSHVPQAAHASASCKCSGAWLVAGNQGECCRDAATICDHTLIV
jgi:hypothetical protein